MLGKSTPRSDDSGCIRHCSGGCSDRDFRGNFLALGHFRGRKRNSGLGEVDIFLLHSLEDHLSLVPRFLSQNNWEYIAEVAEAMLDHSSVRANRTHCS